MSQTLNKKNLPRDSCTSVNDNDVDVVLPGMPDHADDKQEKEKKERKGIIVCFKSCFYSLRL